MSEETWSDFGGEPKCNGSANEPGRGQFARAWQSQCSHCDKHDKGRDNLPKLDVEAQLGLCVANVQTRQREGGNLREHGNQTQELSGSASVVMDGVSGKGTCRSTATGVVGWEIRCSVCEKVMS